MGKMVHVEITSAGEHFQMARVLHETEARSPGLVEPLPKGAVSGVRTENTLVKVDQGQPSLWNDWKKIALFILLAAVLIDVLRLGYLWILE